MTTQIEAAATVAEPEDAGRRAEIDALFRQHGQELGRYLVAMVRDRSLSEDLLQDTFLDAIRARAQLPEVRNPRAWLYGIARNRALQALRRGRRFRGVLTRLSGRMQEDATGDEELVVIQDLLERELTPELRALVLLRYLHGFDAVELAEMTGLNPDAVRQRLARARGRLLSAARAVTEGGETR